MKKIRFITVILIAVISMTFAAMTVFADDADIKMSGNAEQNIEEEISDSEERDMQNDNVTPVEENDVPADTDDSDNYIVSDTQEKSGEEPTESEEQEEPVHVHVYSMIEGKQPLCTESGCLTYWTCEECGKYFSDIEGTEIYDINSWLSEGGEGYLPPKGHILVNGVCSDCGKVEDVVRKSDGNWYYVIGDDIQTDYTGIKPNKNGWWRIVDGKVDFNCTSVEQNEYGWWYIENGKIRFDYTGIKPNKNGWWRIVDGKVDFECTSVEKNENGWWYIENGKVRFDYTGIKPNKNGWWRIVDGKVDFNCTSVEQNEYGWWYIENGRVRFDYTGIKPNKNGWWRIVKGQVDFDCDSIEHNENGWWYIKNGKVDFSFTGVAHNSAGWWYCRSGKVDFTYNGIAANRAGTWILKNGKVTFTQNGVVNGGDGNWYYAKGGKVLPVTGFFTNSNGTWYVVGGKVMFSYTGVAECGSERAWIANGKVVVKNRTGSSDYNMVIFGDSVVEGTGLSNNLYLRHASLMADSLDLNEFNFSKGGSGYLYETRGDKRPTYMDQLNNLALYTMNKSQISNTKVVFIEGGVNDFIQYQRWSSISDSDNYYIGNIIDFISQVKNTFTNANIYFAYGEYADAWLFDNDQDRQAYLSMIGKVYDAVSDMSGVTVIDGGNNDPYYFNNILNQDNDYYFDGVHPNVQGHRIMADKLLQTVTK